MLIRSIVSPALAAALVLSLFSGPAAAADYVLDKAHTQAEFSVTHLGLSKVHGQIPLVSGTASIGANGLPTAISATFDVTAIETNDPNRNEALREKYFEADKYPTITFVERSATGTPSAFTMTGDLTIHGVTKSVALACTVDGTATIRGKQHVAYSGTATIDRRDFGMTFGPMLDNQLIVGYPVAINIETDAVQP